MLNGWLSQWLSVKNMNVDKTKIVEIAASCAVSWNDNE